MSFSVNLVIVDTTDLVAYAWPLMNILCFRRAASATSFVWILQFGLAVHGQETSPSSTMILPERRPESETPHTATGQTGMPLRAPGDPEVMQAERGVINPQTTPTFPLEEPLDPDKYICGRGDVFELNFWGAQNFRLRVAIDLEGRTFISKVGYVSIVGKTLAEARTILKGTIHRYYPGLNFDLSLSAPRTFLIHVVGFVSGPGIFHANPLTRVGTIVARAGLFGSRRRITIRRREGKPLTADLLMYDLTGDTKYNPYLLDGDVIDVPFADVVATISGSVRRPGRYELISSKDYRELLTLGGGYRPTMTRQIPLRLIRRDPKEHNAEQRIAIPDNEKAESEIKLLDEDAVIVPGVGELQRSVILVGPIAGASAADEVTTVRRFPYAEGATVRSLLEAAGGIGSSADLRSGFIKRPDGTIVKVDLEALLIRRDFTADKPIAVGDTVIIPQRRFAVVVEGSVLRPGAYPYNPVFSAAAYLSNAGGPTRNAQSRSNFRVVAPDGSIKKFSDKLILNPGDSISVPERAFARGEIVQLVIATAGLAISSFTLIYLVTR
jgi:polysaccharide export outer membrane protein